MPCNTNEAPNEQSSRAASGERWGWTVASVAVAILCKTPLAGLCKTRLSPPLRPEECAALSACFIRDLSVTIDSLAGADVTGYGVYTPIGSEDRLRRLLPDRFRLLAQSDG